MKRLLGVILAFSGFFFILLIPPSAKMLKVAKEVVLKHSSQEVKKAVVEKVTEVRVKVATDFYKTGQEGIFLDPEGRPFVEIVKLQAKALKASLAVGFLMAVLWVSEAVPIPVVAMIPLFLFPLLGISHYSRAAFPGYFIAYAPYMHHLIVLFIGGFTIAEAMKKWGLHERLALHIVSLVGFSERKLILGIMLATAGISMFVSNTATAAMMMPIVLALVMRKESGKTDFGKAALLAIAYSASIGGVATLIGTPPNVVFAGFAEKLLGVKITFAQWLKICLPFVAVFLPVAWLFLIKYFKLPARLGDESKEAIKQKLKSLGPLKRGELNTLIIFIAVALAWTFRKLIAKKLAIPWLSDSVIAIVAVFAFYLLPVDIKKWEFTLDWETNNRIPWGTLILFGGGLALGEALTNTGAALYLSGFLKGLVHVPSFFLYLAIIIGAVLLTEVTSNTAVASMLMPVLFAMGVATGKDALLLMLTGAVASSFAFMLPVATPPNAIVFGTGYIKLSEMLKAGTLLDLIGAVLWAVYVSLYVARIV